MDIFCISGTEIAPAYIKSMPENMPETHLTSCIRYALSGYVLGEIAVTDKRILLILAMDSYAV